MSRAGLTADDIDYVLMSHGHPDHFGNMNLFPNAVQIFYMFEINGNR
jgi:glyoxylase-like metal-dependent hydrolase (beta-lactamase superfamily II)